MKQLFRGNAQHPLSRAFGTAWGCSLRQAQDIALRLRPLSILMAAVAIALVASSCQPRPSTSPPPPISYQPSLPPASSGPASTAQVTPSLPPPSAVADTSKPVITEFAKASAALNKDWEGSRRSYEEWRQKGACAELALAGSLSGFVASFQKVKRTISRFSQAPMARGVAERLIEAAEKEETSLIELRASWKPGGDAVFQKYETDRLAADRLRRQASQRLNDLQVAGQAENQDAINKYRQALRAIEQDWDTLRKDYDKWRQSLPADGKDKEKDKAIEKERVATETLQKMAASAEGILNRLYALPRPSLIQKPADTLVEAAEKQEAAFRKLKASWKTGDEDSLETYERERLSVNKLRRDGAQGMEAVAAVSLKENKELLGQVTTLYDQVEKDWNDFRSQYDAWRNKGGDCDRDVVRQQLSERLAGFHALAQRTYALPQSAIVRPLAEMLTQAAEKEEVALRQLRDNWKPYDSSFYQTYEKEWVPIDRLRRQAAAGLTDLLQKYSITITETTP